MHHIYILNLLAFIFLVASFAAVCFINKNLGTAEVTDSGPPTDHEDDEQREHSNEIDGESQPLLPNPIKGAHNKVRLPFRSIWNFQC